MSWSTGPGPPPRSKYISYDGIAMRDSLVARIAEALNEDGGKP